MTGTRLIVETTPVAGGEPVLLEVVRPGCGAGCRYCRRSAAPPAREYVGPDPLLSAIHEHERSGA